MLQAATSAAASSGHSRAQEREAARLAAIEHLGAVRPETDEVLQELVDDVRGIFGTALCMVNLVLADVQYFRAWSGDLPPHLVEARQDLRERSMCQHVVETEMPLVVRDFLATEQFKDQHYCVNYGIRFYAGTPLITSDGHTLGSLCLLHTQPVDFGEGQVTLLAAFARAVVGRLELLAALGREREINQAKDELYSTLRATSQEEAERIAGQLQRTLDISVDMITTIGFDGLIRTMNPASKQILGYEPEELIGRHYMELVHPDDRATTQRIARASVLGREISAFNNRFVSRDGADIWIEWNATPVAEEGVWYCVARDITERNRTQEALQESEARHRAVVDTAFDAIILMTAEGIIESYNRGAERIFGYEMDEIIGRPMTLLMPERFREAHTAGLRRYMDTSLTNVLGRKLELAGLRKDGSEFPLELSISQVAGDGHTLFAGILRDTTERKSFEEQLRHQALHDSLSGLPNRALFLDRLQHALDRAHRADRCSAVLCLDLDRFKVINDSLGLEVGDQLLRVVGQRLQACVRPEDTVARLGGDEFAILLEEIADVSDAVRIAERILEGLQASVLVGHHNLSITTSIGITVSNRADDRPIDLLRDADLAMYRAKDTGKYQIFDTSMNASAQERLNSEADLRRAIEQEQLVVHYQPQVDLETGKPVAVEALVRWQHPDRGMVPPLRFIPLAEETGLILPIGRWVLGEACRQANAWQKEYPSDPPLLMSVNLSARQFQNPELVTEVAEALAETGLDPRSLQLEITETVVMEHSASSVSTLQNLKRLGVGLAIDDFGTGYSSLSYLKRFPVDTLKVDKSFVDGLGHNTDDTAIVRAVIGLAHSLRLEVVAEGVETSGQASQLQALGCNVGQGYYFAKPLESEAAGALLAECDIADRRWAGFKVQAQV